MLVLSDIHNMQCLREESHGHESKSQSRGKDGSLFENFGRNCGLFASSKLNSNKDNDQKTKSKETSPYSRILPWMLKASPLKSKEKTNNRTDEKRSSHNIQFLNLLCQGNIGEFPVWILKEEENGEDGYRSKWKINLSRIRPET
jgi:hypothetical protein